VNDGEPETQRLLIFHQLAGAHAFAAQGAVARAQQLDQTPQAEQLLQSFWRAWLLTGPA
jgi:hypothetical protein